MERDYQDKLMDLQTKMELAIKEREIEVRVGLDERNKLNKSKYNNELQQAHDMVIQRESDLDQMERINFQIAEDKKVLEQSLNKLEDQMQELQKEAALQLATMQQESE